MENKQIIVYDVDVAKCIYFTSELGFNNCGHICKGTKCKYKRLWYKKQLASKEQEYDGLRIILTEIKEIAERNHKTKEEFFKIRYSRLTKFLMGALNGRHNLSLEIMQKISEVENG